MNLVLFGGFVYDAWMTIVIALNWLTYNLIEILYRVFVAVANVNLFGKDIFDAFTNRMYIVVGMAMLFIFAYNIILMIINPEDKKGTGQMSKVVKETIISLVLVILLPTIFNYMAIFQKNILDSQIISQIILGNGTETKDDCDFSKYKSLEKLDDTISINKLETSCKNYNDNEITSPSVRGAYLMTPTLLNAFLYPVNYSMDTCEEYIKSCDKEKLTECDSSKIEDEKDRDLCGKFYYSFKMSQYNGSIGYLLNRSYITDSLKNEDQKLLNFNYLYSLIGGILALVMFASYTIMIGVRVAKLGFLEIIAPIPVMMRIIPKQKEALYDKWFNQLKNTYLDLFIRMIIINFALYAITLIPDVIKELGGSGDDNIVVVGLAKAVVILGILQFAKEAPSLIKEFFGNSGRFSIKGGFDKWKESGHQIGGAAGAVGAVGVMGSRSIKNIATAGKGNRLKTAASEALNIRKMPNVLKAGFDAGKKSGVSNFVSNIGDAEHSVRYKRGMFGTAKDNIDLAKSKRLGIVSQKYSDLEKILDNKTSIQSLTTSYEEQKKEAAKKIVGRINLNGTSYDMSNRNEKQQYLNELDKQFKTDRNKLRMEELQKGISNNDKEIKDNYGIYLDALKENKSEINAMLKEYDPNSTGLNLEMLDEKNIINLTADGDLFNANIRTPGSNAGKESNSINRRVQERKSKSNGN